MVARHCSQDSSYGQIDAFRFQKQICEAETVHVMNHIEGLRESNVSRFAHQAIENALGSSWKPLVSKQQKLQFDIALHLLRGGIHGFLEVSGPITPPPTLRRVESIFPVIGKLNANGRWVANPQDRK